MANSKINAHISLSVDNKGGSLAPFQPVISNSPNKRMKRLAKTLSQKMMLNVDLVKKPWL